MHVYEEDEDYHEIKNRDAKAEVGGETTYSGFIPNFSHALWY